MCGPVGVGVQAACRGVGLKRAQWNSQGGGVEHDWGAPPGQAPRTLAQPAAEPAHCSVYKSPPFLLFLLSPSPYLPPFLSSSQTTPAFRLSGGRANWWARRRLVLGGSHRQGGGGGPRAEVGREGILGGGHDLGRLLLPTSWCPTLGASGWERPQEEAGRERLGEGGAWEERVSSSLAPGGKGF